MTKIDLRIFELDNEGSPTFSTNNLRTTGSGLEKILNMWLKFFYNEDCGGLIQMMRANKLSVKNEGDYRTKVSIAILNANEKLKRIQIDQDLKGDEKFKDCTIKSLDMQPQEGLINLNLEFSTYTETLSINI